MRRALIALLICAALALIGIWSWLLFPPARDGAARAARAGMCGIDQYCAHAAQPPIELRLGDSALPRDHRDYPLVLDALGTPGTDRIYPYDRIVGAMPGTQQREFLGGSATNRLYLAKLGSGTEALVIVRDTFTQRHARLLRRGVNLTAYRVWTDAEPSLRRFSLLDPATRRGDTFELRQAPRSEAFTYVSFAPDSPEIHGQWLSGKRSTCGYGPLTAVPPDWQREYSRICRR